jgi:hypothetical protein
MSDGSGLFGILYVAVVIAALTHKPETPAEKEAREKDVARRKQNEESERQVAIRQRQRVLEEQQEAQRLLAWRAEREPRVKKVAKTGTDVCMDCLAIEPKRCVCGSCLQCASYVYSCGHCSNCSSSCSGNCDNCHSCCGGSCD